MSLKVVHLAFICVSVLLAFGFGVWGVVEAAAHSGGSGYLAMGLLAFVAGAALIVYGIKFLRKMRHVSNW